MAIHIANPEVVAIVHEAARRWNTTLTMAVKIAVKRRLRELLADGAWSRLKHDRMWKNLKARARRGAQRA
jgi:hypothetical protein